MPPDDGVSYEQRIQTICLLFLTTLAIAAALYLFKAVLIPFVLAIFLTYCLTPVIDAQIRWLRAPRLVAIVSTILLGCVMLLLFGLLVSAAVGEVRRHVPDYEAQIDGLLERAGAFIGSDRPGSTQRSELTATLLKKVGEAATQFLAGTVTGIKNILQNGALVVIFMIFMVSGRRGEPRGILAEIEARTKRYILTMVFVSGITGFLVGLTLAILGIPFAWMFGFLAFLMNFIPNVGSIVATLMPIPVILLSDHSVAVQVLAIAIPSAIQFVVGNLLQPKIMGESLDLHPITVLMSLIFFGIIWGIVGMFLATPIAAIIRILLERYGYTRPVALIMAGRLDELSEA